MALKTRRQKQKGGPSSQPRRAVARFGGAEAPMAAQARGARISSQPIMKTSASKIARRAHEGASFRLFLDRGIFFMASVVGE